MITIPKSVEVIAARCFAACDRLTQINWEKGSRLARIELEAFHESALQKTYLLPSLVYIGPRAFPPTCKIILPKCSKYADMQTWRRLVSTNPNHIFGDENAGIPSGTDVPQAEAEPEEAPGGCCNIV
jgi:hypothetical protein